MNYALFGTSALSGSNGSGFADTLGAGLTASIFGPYGVGTAGFLVNSPLRGRAARSRSCVLDVNWRWDNSREQTTLLVGDTVSTPGWWGRAVRFGGVQYGTNFALQPGFVTYPLMAVSGLATVPSTADILINNVRVAEQAVPAGPFTISNLPTMTGAGELNMVVRDAFGQQQVVTQPFYIAQQLLRPGLTEFSVRRRRGTAQLRTREPRLRRQRSPTAGCATASAPTSPASCAPRPTTTAPQSAPAPMCWSASSACSASAARPARVRTATAPAIWSASTARRLSSRSARASRGPARTIARLATSGRRSPQWSTAFVRTSFGQYGSLAFGYTGQRYYDAEPLTIYSASYSINVGARAFLTLTGSQDPRACRTRPRRWLCSRSRSVTLTSATASVQSTRRDSETTRIGEAYVQRSLPVGEGYGYYVRANTDRTVGRRRAVRRARSAATRSKRRPTTAAAALRASAAGGIAWVDDTMMFAQPIEQSFAVVKVGELDGVRVLQSNQDVGRTQAGRLALAQVPSLNGVHDCRRPIEPYRWTSRSRRRPGRS